MQLFQCAQNKFGNLMLVNNPRLMAKSESCVAKQMKSIAVIKVAIGVKRADFCACIRTMMNEKQKPAISLQSVSVTVRKAM